MKTFKSKKLTMAIALGMAVSFGGFTATAVAAPMDSVEVAVNVALQQGTIDWTKGSDSKIEAIGVGLPGNKSMAMARVAAIMDAQRNLLGIIKGVQIDSDTLMEDLLVTSDVVKRNIGGVLQGAQVVAEGTNADGSYFVRMSVPLYGASNSVAAAALPEVVKNITPEPIPVVNVKATPLKKETIKKVQSSAYTGVVVDASGLGLKPTFSPIIYDTNGRAIYGINNIDSAFAIANGMVGYANELGQATSGSRAGANPMVVKAESVKGGTNSTNPVNVVVSVEDADKILLANEKSGMLENCAVMFVR